MMKTDIWVYDIGRGLCVAIGTPNGYLIMIDAGNSDVFHPVNVLSGLNWANRGRYSLAKLIVTHPHNDHISDIQNLSETMQPSMILRRKDLDWSKVTSGGISNALSYYKQTYMPPQYDVPVTDCPDWGDGFYLDSYCLGIDKVAKISTSDSSYVNNSSLINIIKYLNFTTVIAGDIEKEGMKALLDENTSLRNAISGGVHFFITPHHGHSSGFSPEWFQTAGATIIFNIASERRKQGSEDEAQTKVDERYSKPEFCLAGNNEKRLLVSTKADGHIHIWIMDNGQWVATAILAYSFGGLRREGGSEEEMLPPGVSESELLAACVSPELDSITAKSVLSDLRNSCLYLHYDGVRYCFKKEPNVTKLIEDAEQEVARRQDDVRREIRDRLTEKLKGKMDSIVWPDTSQNMPDKEPVFLVGYLAPDFASKSKTEQEKAAIDIFSNYGDKPRQYRNGIGLAVPDKKQIEPLKRAIRYILAIDKINEKKHQHRLTKDQLDQLKERLKTEEAAVESAFRGLYTSVWLPKVDNGSLSVEKVEVGGRPLQSTGVHERVMELLTGAGTPKIHSTLKPHKLTEKVKLGESVEAGERPRTGIKTSDVRDAFFSFIAPPRLSTDKPIKKAVLDGVAEKQFGYTVGAVPKLGDDGKYQIDPDKVAFGKTLFEEEIDLDSGFLMVPDSIPLKPDSDKPDKDEDTPGAGGQPAGGVDKTKKPDLSAGGRGDAGGGLQSSVTIRFNANREQVFAAFKAIANLADKSDDGKVRITIEGTSGKGYDQSWLRNAVEEPLDEADVEIEDS